MGDDSEEEDTVQLKPEDLHATESRYVPRYS